MTPVGYRWPDTRSILLEVLAPFATTYARQTVSWEQDTLNSATQAAITVRVVGGPVDGVSRSDRVRVDVFAVGDDAAFALAEQVGAYLVDRFHYVPDQPGLGQIDSVSVEISPVDVPYPSQVLSQVTATYQAELRPLD